MAAAGSVLIIGGGVIGLSTAYYALRRGFHPIIVEREGPGHEGCSHGNAGLIVPSHFVPLAAPGMVALGLKWMWSPRSPFHVKPRLSRDLLSWGWKFYRAANAAHVARSAPLLRDLSLSSRACFEELAALPGADFGLVKRGLLLLCKSKRRLEEEAGTAAMARELGLIAGVLTAEETARFEPALRMDIAGSVHYPQDAHLSPGRFMTWMRAYLEGSGAVFHDSTEVIGWVLDGDRIAGVRTARGELDAREYVLCGGSWSPGIARGLRLELPLQAGRGYSLTWTRPRRLPAIPLLLTEARVAVTPMDGSLRLAGTMEIAGHDAPPSPARIRGIIESAARYFPDLTPDDFRDIPAWSGFRPCSPDGLPYIGRAGPYANLIVATGHAMMGLSLGPITGKLVAEILSGETPSIDITPLHPDRYVTSHSRESRR